MCYMFDKCFQYLRNPGQFHKCHELGSPISLPVRKLGEELNQIIIMGSSFLLEKKNSSKIAGHYHIMKLFLLG